MGLLSADRKVYMEPAEEGGYSSSCSSPSSKGLTYSNSNKYSATNTSTAEESSSTIQSRLKKLSSMNPMKSFSKLGSRNNYEQIREEQQDAPSSDMPTRVPGLSSSQSLQHRNMTTIGQNNNIHHGEEEEDVELRIDDMSAAGAAATGSEGFSNGESPPGVRHGGTHCQSSCPTPDNNSHEASLNRVDSFDEEDQFQRQRSVSTSGFCKHPTNPTSPFLPGAEGASSPRLPPPYPKAQSAAGRRKEAAVAAPAPAGLGIYHEGSYDFRKDPLPEGRPNGGGDSSSFEFGTVIPGADPPTRLIGSFLRRQTESGSNFLDLDLDMDELTPSPGANNNNGSFSAQGDVEAQQQSPSPSSSPQTNANSFWKNGSYGGGEDNNNPPPTTTSVPLWFAPSTAPNAAEFRGLKDQTKYSSDPLLHPQEGKRDVTINVGGEDDRSHLKNIKGAAAVIGAAGAFKGRGSGGVRWRKNGTPPISTAAEEEVVKVNSAPYVVRPTFSRLKSRLADLPKPPPEITKASGPMDTNINKGDKLKSGQVKNSGQLKSGLMGNKLKKVQEEEEEDPLKVTDLPEKYRKRDTGVWTILQLLAFVGIVGGLITVLVFRPLRTMKRGGLMLWKWALLVMVVFSGRLISGWIIWVLVFIIEKNFLLRKRVVYFVYALRKGVQNCLWLGLALLAWHLMIDPKVDSTVKVVKYVTKVLVCFLVASLIVVVKTLGVKIFASSFHVNNYFERIQEALFNQYIMETLAGPPVLEFQQIFEDDQKLNDEIAGLREAGASGPSLTKLPDLPPLNLKRPPSVLGKQSMNLKSEVLGTQSGMIGKSPKAPGAAEPKKESKSGRKEELDKGISVDYLQKLDLSNISAWNMKRLIHIIRNSTLTHSLEETVNSVDCMETEIQSEWQAKSAAKQIFRNVAKPRQKVIVEEDLLRFMREEETKKALPLFDGAIETKCITKQALKKWVIDVYRERRALALSLNDTKTAVNKLHRIVDVVVGIIIIIIWLLVLGIATSKLLLFMSSQILLLILVWGNTLKTVFEAIVFLFIMHPFDVGDRCVIDGTQLVVEEMNILTTVFLGDFNVKIWYPNSVLATKPIQNYYRSPEMGDGVDFIVQASTPVEKISAFKEKIGKYIASKTNHWHQDFALNVMQMLEGEKMKLSLGVKHTMNYQDMGEIIKRRSELLLEVKLCLQELCIEYHIPAQELHVRTL